MGTNWIFLTTACVSEPDLKAAVEAFPRILPGPRDTGIDAAWLSEHHLGSISLGDQAITVSLYPTLAEFAEELSSIESRLNGHIGAALDIAVLRPTARGFFGPPDSESSEELARLWVRYSARRWGGFVHEDTSG